MKMILALVLAIQTPVTIVAQFDFLQNFQSLALCTFTPECASNSQLSCNTQDAAKSHCKCKFGKCVDGRVTGYVKVHEEFTITKKALGPSPG